MYIHHSLTPTHPPTHTHTHHISHTLVTSISGQGILEAVGIKKNIFKYILKAARIKKKVVKCQWAKEEFQLSMTLTVYRLLTWSLHQPIMDMKVFSLSSVILRFSQKHRHTYMQYDSCRQHMQVYHIRSSVESNVNMPHTCSTGKGITTCIIYN